MPIEHVFRIRQLLEHINTDRWGTGGRNAAVLLVVAERSHWPCPAPLTVQDFVSDERTPKQARYDREVVLPRLVADRVLIQVGTGRRPYWGINADLTHWHRVPGFPSWRSVVSLFSGRLWAKPARWNAKSPGQSVAGTPLEALQAQIWEEALSVIQPASSARLWASGARRPGQTPPERALQRADLSAYVNSSEVSKETSSPLEEVRGGPKLTDEGKKLVGALSVRLGKPVFGGFAEQLDGAAVVAGDRLPALIARAETTQLFMIREAVADLVAFAELAPAGPKVCKRCGGTGRWEARPDYFVVCNHLELS